MASPSRARMSAKMLIATGVGMALASDVPMPSFGGRSAPPAKQDPAAAQAARQAADDKRARKAAKAAEQAQRNLAAMKAKRVKKVNQP